MILNTGAGPSTIRNSSTVPSERTTNQYTRPREIQSGAGTSSQVVRSVCLPAQIEQRILKTDLAVIEA